MRIIWMSDIHLNFLNEELRKDFYLRVKEKVATEDVIVISGDIAESHNFVPFLKDMEEIIGCPVYFVLGNHDYYGSNIADVRNSAKKLGWLQWKPIGLTEHTIILGVDGWGDCRYGDFENSYLTMSDWLYIEDLRKGYNRGMSTLKKVLQSLADKDAKSLKRKVLKAIKDGFKRVIIVTHVPPFQEVCLYAGKKSTPSGLPFFASKILGDTILPIAYENENIEFLWLSGHTHSRAVYSPTKNLTVKVAKSEYYFPEIEESILI